MLKLWFLPVSKQQAAKFWTSGMDLGCKGSYGYCTTNRLLRDEAKCVVCKWVSLKNQIWLCKLLGFMQILIYFILSVTLRWENDQDHKPKEDCVAVNIQQTALLRDENCESKFRYICEVSKFRLNCNLSPFSAFQARTLTGAKAVERECGNAFNLTAGNVIQLLSLRN